MAVRGPYARVKTDSGYLGWWDWRVDNTSDSGSDDLMVITGSEQRVVAHRDIEKCPRR
jgi:hypothetical protein